MKSNSSSLALIKTQTNLHVVVCRKRMHIILSHVRGYHFCRLQVSLRNTQCVDQTNEVDGCSISFFSARSFSAAQESELKEPFSFIPSAG